MAQNKVIKNILYLAILTTVVVITWVASSVWYSLMTPTTPADTNQYTEPISPTFDMTTLEHLGTRIKVPVDFSQPGDYITDPRNEQVGSPSAETITPPPIDDIQPEQETEGQTEEVIMDQNLLPDNSQSVSPTPEQTL